MATITESTIEDFQFKLLKWFYVHGRKFHWRHTGLSTYQLVIAETLLQRTRAETVSNFFTQFIQDYPSWESLSKANLDLLEDYLKPIGLYKQRSKRLKNLALEMCKRGGEFPTNRTELESIPFIGQYIANAIELIIYNKPSPLLDVNMSRLLERYFGERKKADIRYDPYLQELAYKIVNHQYSKEINWAVLDYAAIICKARKPICNSCIFKIKCNYFNEYLQISNEKI